MAERYIKADGNFWHIAKGDTENGTVCGRSLAGKIHNHSRPRKLSRLCNNCWRAMPEDWRVRILNSVPRQAL